MMQQLIQQLREQKNLSDDALLALIERESDTTAPQSLCAA